MCRINFMLSRIEHEKSFITSGPGVSSMSSQVLTTQTIDAKVTLLLFMLNYSVTPCSTYLWFDLNNTKPI